MFRMLESQAPPKQTFEDTINTLSSRLQSATLLEDRRAAIQGLRPFAKSHPASVASGALRNLINSLNSDSDDVDNTRLVLETLLMLFSPDESSPEASDDISLWLADEFTQRQENITVLLDILDRPEFFLRLYALQLLSAISSARPERTQECVYTAPLGVSRLVAVLDDNREAIKNEGLLLLIALTPSSPDLQKLVAFENAFDRIFAIIDSEGSLSRGGVVVQDCLSLLAHLLRLNTSNQSSFRETGGIPKIAAVLRSVIEDQRKSGVEDPDWNPTQRDKNVWGFLSVIRFFLQGSSTSTQMNQARFWEHKVTFLVLEIGFLGSLSPAIRSEALATCADLIRANANLQEKFALRDISMHIPASRAPFVAPHAGPNGDAKTTSTVSVNIVQGLLDVALAVSVQETMDVRLASCECLKAYLKGHGRIRLYFLGRARDGHLGEGKESDNIFTILIEDGASTAAADASRLWIASVLLFHLLYEDYDAKKLAMDIADGDAEKGEEVVTCIQALSTNLIVCSQRGNNDRITIGYLTLLCGWLFEDPDAVNDFLQEGSHIQSLIQMVLQPASQKTLEAGLSAFLLGIIYEFSTKDSPIPRKRLHELLTTRLGREQYVDKMTKLRENPFVRDFEVLSSGYNTDQFGGKAELHFDKLFVEFLKDNFSRMLRSLDREPGLEIPVVANGVQKGVSRELVDTLKSQVEEKSTALQKAESEILTLEHKLGQEQADLRKIKESASIDYNRIKSINESLQRNHEEEINRLQSEHERSLAQSIQETEASTGRLQNEHERRISGMQQAHDAESRRLQTEHAEQVSGMQQAHGVEVHRLQDEITGSTSRLQEEMKNMRREQDESYNRESSLHEAEVNELKASIQKLERDLEKSSQQLVQDLKTAHEEYASNREALEGRLTRAEGRAEEAEKRAQRAQDAAQENEEARAAAQTELDDLFMVLGDLEEKRAKDKERLKALGQEVSDAEDGDEDDEEDEEDGEDGEAAKAPNTTVDDDVD